MLNCGCHYDDDAPWYFTTGKDFEKLNTKRGRRCKSCDKIIKVGDDCLKFYRTKFAEDDIEYKIYGDSEIDITAWYMCGRCGEIYLNLEAAGYCMQPDDNMAEALNDYWDITGFVPPDA